MTSDSVFLEGMRFYAFHGVHAEERVLGQRFLVDVEVKIDLRTAGEHDDLSQTISYSTIYNHVREIVEGPPRQLIEAVAEEIATVLLDRYPIHEVVVTVRKPEVPLRGAMLAAAGVRIRRDRGSGSSA